MVIEWLRYIVQMYDENRRQQALLENMGERLEWYRAALIEARYWARKLYQERVSVDVVQEKKCGCYWCEDPLYKAKL